MDSIYGMMKLEVGTLLFPENTELCSERTSLEEKDTPLTKLEGAEFCPQVSR